MSYALGELAQLAVVVTVLVFVVVAYRRRWWLRRVRAVPEFEQSFAALEAGDPARALELGWTAYERTQRWRGAAAAFGQAILGDRLVQIGHWEDGLTHLLPGIAGLRDKRGGEEVLARALLNAAWAYDTLNEPAAGLPLVEESLTLMVRYGRHRQHSELYHRGLRSRAGLLRRLGRYDEAIRAAQEAIMKARAVDPAGMTTTVLFQSLANTLMLAGRPAEAAAYAQATVDRLRDAPATDAPATDGPATDGPAADAPASDAWRRQYLALGWDSLARARFALGAYADAVAAYEAALPICEDLFAALPDRHVLRLVYVRTGWAHALVRAGRTEEAEKALTPVPDLIGEVRLEPESDRQDALGEVALVRAEICAERQQLEQARVFAAAAERHFLKAQEGRPPGDPVDLTQLRALQERLNSN